MFKIMKNQSGGESLILHCDVCGKGFSLIQYEKGEICVFPDMFEKQVFAHRSCAAGQSEQIKNVDDFSNGFPLMVYLLATRGVDDGTLLVEIKRKVLNEANKVFTKTEKVEKTIKERAKTRKKKAPNSKRG